MKFFLDTEFIEYPGTLQLISVGLVAENGDKYYAESSECDLRLANNWVKDNVINKLVIPFSERKSNAQIGNEIYDFVSRRTDKPEFWGYYADYDWVVFCWLQGPMSMWPEGWPMYCKDFKQYLDQYGNPPIGILDTCDHNALNDARWLREAWYWFDDLKCIQVETICRLIQLAPDVFSKQDFIYQTRLKFPTTPLINFEAAFHFLINEGLLVKNQQILRKVKK